jgi:hypothetical protein
VDEACELFSREAAQSFATPDRTQGMFTTIALVAHGAQLLLQLG